MKVYNRTENGTTVQVSVKDAMAEVNAAMMGPRRNIREMSSVQGSHTIVYRDRRRVRLDEVDAPERTMRTGAYTTRKKVTVKGKSYIVTAVTPARPRTPEAVSWIPEAYVSYWAERNGTAFGPTRSGKASMRPGTVGRAIWDAVND